MSKLVWAKVINDNFYSNFISFELLTVREYHDDCGETYIDCIMNKTEYLQNSHKAVDDVFYRIIGNYSHDTLRSSVVIGTYSTVEQARRILQDLTGKEVELHIF
jgi:hypothetical protein